MWWSLLTTRFSVGLFFPSKNKIRVQSSPRIRWTNIQNEFVSFWNKISAMLPLPLFSSFNRIHVLQWKFHKIGVTMNTMHKVAISGISFTSMIVFLSKKREQIQFSSVLPSAPWILFLRNATKFKGRNHPGDMDCTENMTLLSCKLTVTKLRDLFVQKNHSIYNEVQIQEKKNNTEIHENNLSAQISNNASTKTSPWKICLSFSASDKQLHLRKKKHGSFSLLHL